MLSQHVRPDIIFAALHTCAYAYARARAQPSPHLCVTAAFRIQPYTYPVLARRLSISEPLLVFQHHSLPFLQMIERTEPCRASTGASSTSLSMKMRNTQRRVRLSSPSLRGSTLLMPRRLSCTCTHMCASTYPVIDTQARTTHEPKSARARVPDACSHSCTHACTQPVRLPTDTNWRSCSCCTAILRVVRRDLYRSSALTARLSTDCSRSPWPMPGPRRRRRGRSRSRPKTSKS